MQINHRRFVLVAGLVAATTSAQAPKLDNSKFREVGSSAPAAAREQDRQAPQEASGRTIGDYSPRYTDPQGRPDDDKYALRRVFTDIHGEFMNRRERYQAPIELRARVLPHEQIKGEPGSFDMLGYDFDARIPALVSTDGYLTFGAYYQGRSYQFSDRFGTRGGGANAAGMSDETLHAAGAHLGFGVFLHDNVLFEMETSPGAWSDFDATLHHKDFDFPSSAVFTLRAVDHLFFKVGARYNQIFEEAPWLPYLGINWEPIEGLRIDILAPERAEISYWPSSSTGLLFGGEVNGGEYHIRTNEALGNRQADVRVQEVVGYFGLVQRFSDNVSFRGRIGAVLGGDYQLTTGAAGFNETEGTLEAGLFAEIAFGIDF